MSPDVGDVLLYTILFKTYTKHVQNLYRVYQSLYVLAHFAARKTAQILVMV